MNRGQRRALQRTQPKQLKGKSQAQILNSLIKNGLTPEDLEKSYREGFDAGFMAASPEITKTAYAAMALALRDDFKFGRTRIIRVLSSVNDNIMLHLDSTDAIDKVYRDIGISLNLKDPLEPVKEAER